ncbi:MAG: GntR family transcriptional regulator [Vampirovibrionales bacterium]|nr:GntR family transcriptional regulator [Vampirovibrionales bacterium]
MAFSSSSKRNTAQQLVDKTNFQKTSGSSMASSVLIQGGALASKPNAMNDTLATSHVTKANVQQLSIEHMPTEKPDFKGNPGVTKDGLIAEWLKTWISCGLETGELTEQHLLPRKHELASYLGVSVGTVQNAIRFVEDDGYVESKQRIGTVIRAANRADSRMRKQTSKREQAIVAIKQTLLTRSIQPGEALPSAREMAKIIGSAPNTTRLALEYLAAQGVLHSQGTRGNKANWFLREIPDCSSDHSVAAIESETLIDQLERDLKTMITEKYDVGDKFPAHLELATELRVSIKTVHDAMKRLSAQGIIKSKRGRYGTFVARKVDTTKFFPSDQKIFLPAEEASFYNYERVESHIQELIASQYQQGDKLPPMNDLATTLNVSTNTIRKALQNLAKNNVVTFSRGRYGGTFVAKGVAGTSQGAKPSAKGGLNWLSVNPAALNAYRKQPTA